MLDFLIHSAVIFPPVGLMRQTHVAYFSVVRIFINPAVKLIRLKLLLMLLPSPSSVAHGTLVYSSAGSEEATCEQS